MPQKKEEDNVAVYENQPRPEVQQLPLSPQSAQVDTPGNQTSTHTCQVGKEPKPENVYENDTELGYEAPQTPSKVNEYEYINPSSLM